MSAAGRWILCVVLTGSCTDGNPATGDGGKAQMADGGTRGHGPDAGPDASNRSASDRTDAQLGDAAREQGPEGGTPAKKDGGAADDSGTANGKDDAGVRCEKSCDDGVDCTADQCLNGTCANKIDATACDPGKACDPRGAGCTTTSPCGSDADCTDSDPCTRNETCNMAPAACEWDILDGDRDGYAPKTCGGADTNDANPDIYPGSPEICDGVDNDGDGEVDEEPAASESCGGATCTGGGCPGCTSLKDRAGLEEKYTWSMLGSGTMMVDAWGLAGLCVFSQATPTKEKACFNDRAKENLSGTCRQCFNPFMNGYAGCCLLYPPPADPDYCETCLCAAGGPGGKFEACAGVPYPRCP